MTERVPTSEILRDLLRHAPGEQVTLAWLIAALGDRSFGIVLLLLGLLALLPGASAVIGLLLAIPALQMIRTRAGPVFPRRLATRGFRTARLAALVRRAVPVLRYLERFVRPRWTTPFETTKQVVGVVTLLLGTLLLAPVPLSNIPVALTILLLAFAYLEEDGVLLCAALAASLVALGTAAYLGLQTVRAAIAIGS